MKKKIKRVILIVLLVAFVALIFEILVFKHSFKEPVKTEIKESE